MNFDLLDTSQNILHKFTKKRALLIALFNKPNIFNFPISAVKGVIYYTVF